MLVDISKFSTMKVGGKVSEIIRIRSKKDLIRGIELAKQLHLPFFILGEGSNTIFRDVSYRLLVFKMENYGTSIVKSNKKKILMEVGAGRAWDSFVKWSVKNNFSGIEALSGIPGTIGAAPIQNIGAYGTEVKSAILYVRAYDTETKKFIRLSKRQCGFKYRDSIFKKQPGKFIVWSVCFGLKKNKTTKIPKYKDTAEYFKKRNIKSPTPKQIRKAILEIRRVKLPDPKLIPNCGSFFKNPIVENNLSKKLKSKYTEMPIFPADGGGIKIPAGWLIEKAGFRGYARNKVGTYKNNALVLVNKGGSFKNLDALRRKIKKRVLKMFKIKLEEEVNII